MGKEKGLHVERFVVCFQFSGDGSHVQKVLGRTAWPAVAQVPGNKYIYLYIYIYIIVAGHCDRKTRQTD